MNDTVVLDNPVAVPTKRTWSRELSAVLIAGCFFLAGTGKTEELAIVVWPVAAFALPSFGFRQPTVDSWMRGTQPNQPIDRGRP